jgi:ectoine hydroxylase-related dioxygenase (phytanoyl-CoA dioxygenase family)
MSSAPAVSAKNPQLDQWAEQFHRDGYLLVHDVLTPEQCKQLRADLDTELASTRNAMSDKQDHEGTMRLRVRLFEHSDANLRLFEQEPIVTLAEKLIGEGQTHVIHNNSFVTKPGGGLSFWHQDDPAQFLVTDGVSPKNIRLRVMFFTANYYLTDVEEQKYGGTEVIPGSHLFGKVCPTEIIGTEYERLAMPCLGKAGSVVLFNNQVWHRGGPNQSDRIRYITQVTYAWRIIGHRFFPFMNYQMPKHCYENASPRMKRLLGFLPMGAYG